MLNTFNRTETLFKHIDTRINSMILKGNSIDEIITNLQSSHDSFQNKVLSSKVVDTRFKYVYTHNIVIRKRIQDFHFMKTLQYNYEEYQSYNVAKLFRLVLLRDRMNVEKCVVELPADFVISE